MPFITQDTIKQENSRIRSRKIAEATSAGSTAYMQGKPQEPPIGQEFPKEYKHGWWLAKEMYPRPNSYIRREMDRNGIINPYG